MHIASQRTLEYGQVVLSTDNVFNRCRQKSHIGQPAQTHPLQQLEIIGNYVSDLMAICKRGGAAGTNPAVAAVSAAGTAGAAPAAAVLAAGTGGMAASAAGAT